MKMQRYKVEVGHQDEAKPCNILGAIANEGDIDSCYIGSIEIHDTYSTVDLPAGMPKETFNDLKKTWVCGKPLNLSELKSHGGESAPFKQKPKGKPEAKKPSRKRTIKHKKSHSKDKKPARARTKNTD